MDHQVQAPAELYPLALAMPVKLSTTLQTNETDYWAENNKRAVLKLK